MKKVLELSDRISGLMKANRYGEAIVLSKQVSALMERVAGKKHPLYFSEVHNLAQLYQLNGDFENAEATYRRVIKEGDSVLGPTHKDVLDALSRIGYLRRIHNDFARAEESYGEVVKRVEKQSGADSIETVMPQMGVAEIALVRGDLVRSEAIVLRCIAIFERLRGASDPSIVVLQGKLAQVYVLKGDFDRAERLTLNSIALAERRNDEHMLISLYGTLATIYARTDIRKSLPLEEKALTLALKRWHATHANVVAPMVNLAGTYAQLGDFALAERFFLRAYEIDVKNNGPEATTVLGNIGGFYQMRGDYPRSEQILLQVLQIEQKRFPASDHHITALMSRLALHYQVRGEIKRALDYRRRYNVMSEEELATLLSSGFEDQKRAAAQQAGEATHMTLSLHLDSAPNDAEVAAFALETVLRRKGRVLDSMTDSMGALLRHSTDPRDAELLNVLATKRELLARTTLAPASKNPDERKARIAAMEAQVQTLESELSSRSALFRTEGVEVTLDRVREALPDDGVLVEYISRRPYDAKQVKRSEMLLPARYVAYVLPKKGPIRWVELGQGAAIDAQVRAFREALSRQSEHAKALGRELSKSIVDAVLPFVGDARTLFLAPDGALNLVPFAALPQADGRYLIEARTLVSLSSGRELLRLAAMRSTSWRDPPLIVADPDFGPDAALSPASSSLSRSIDFTRAHIEPLPGTSEEANAISTSLAGSKVLRREQATESAVKGVHGPRVLHIATHGFFLGADASRGETLERGLMLEGAGPSPASDPTATDAPAIPTFVADPLLRSGLLFAGVKRPPAAGNDGILTASEASGLDLWGTQLVVLSACETGVGEARDGEGVYGLRRAFAMAGAQTQVLSLWKVDDNATRDLMVAYYRALERGRGRADAMRDAQLGMLKRSAVAHPYFWASFVVSGSHLPLSEKHAPDLGKVHGRGCGCEVEPKNGSAPSILALALAVTIMLRRRGRRIPLPS